MKARAAALCAILLWLLWVVNKGAYKGYLSGDELDTFAWMRVTTIDVFARGFLSPEFYPNNFRPVAHFLTWSLFHLFGPDFRVHLAAAQILHLANLLLLWYLLPGRWAARAFGVVFFAFHIACFENYWKSMFMFDVLCATFCLASLLAWTKDRWWLSLLLFWCAYKSKELAIGLPVILLAYEYWFGTRRWRHLLPFFAVSLCFGLQAVAQQGGKTDDYGLRLTPALLAHSIDFYASRVLLLPHLGYVLLIIPLLTRNRRIWWGLGIFLVFLAPMLLLPNRLLSPYLYLPLAGLSYALSALADQRDYRWVAAALLLWLPWNYSKVPAIRSTVLAEADESRAYVQSLTALAQRQPQLRTFLIDGFPPQLYAHGVKGALQLAFQADTVTVYSVETRPTLDVPDLALLTWDRPTQRLYPLLRAEQTEASYIEMTRLTPIWQLDQGWFNRDNTFRWTEPYAKAHLLRPAEAREFQVRVNIGVDYLKQIGQVTLETRLDGQTLGRQTFTESGWQTVKYPLPPAPAARAQVEFLVTPPLRPANGDPRQLGIPIGAFGFR